MDELALFYHQDAILEFFSVRGWGPVLNCGAGL
jgi:hypothetical protein